MPTVAETLPGYQLVVWYGLFGPAGMPPALADRINAAANKAMLEPSVKTHMDGIGVEVVQASAKDFGVLLRSDYDRYGKVIRELGIKGE
ncbi:hypothetical protein BH09PSE6_BH09PSE6_13890 [soil metagenome]